MSKRRTLAEDENRRLKEDLEKANKEMERRIFTLSHPEPPRIYSCHIDCTVLAWERNELMKRLDDDGIQQFHEIKHRIRLQANYTANAEDVCYFSLYMYVY